MSLVASQILQVSRSLNSIDFTLCDQFGKYHKLTVSSVYGPLNVSLDGATLLLNQQVDFVPQQSTQTSSGNKRKSEATVDSRSKRSKQSHREKRPREPLTIESDWR